LDQRRRELPPYALPFLTDGTTWKLWLSDLKKIIVRQNQRRTTQIYKTKIATQLKAVLDTLKSEMEIT
jgi:predicted RNA-binding protein